MFHALLFLRRRFLVWHQLLLASILLCAISTSCMTSSNGFTSSHDPRHDQNKWLDENLVITTVVKCVSNADFVSRRPQATREYATLLRTCYMTVSEGGVDVDAGVRALNFIHKIHRDARGDKKLWQNAVKKAQDTTADHGRLPGLPIPAEYK